MKNLCSSLFHLFSFFSYLIRFDLRERYIGTYMGVIWGLVQPVVTVMIMIVVFRAGFKDSGIVAGFEEWLIVGYIVWQYMSEGVINGTNAIVERSYLVKKMVFEVEVLPVVKIMSVLVMHVVVMLVVLVILWHKGYEMGLRDLEVFYYLTAGTILTYGLSMLSSSLAVFTRDVSQVVNMGLQLCFWGTPIFWNGSMLAEEYRWVIELNPFAYVVEGYRHSLLGGERFWERPETITYWIITGLVVWIGRLVFKRLRPHFADVL